MNFLLILLSVVFLFTFMRRWSVLFESFDGNCITPIIPVFNQDKMSYDNINSLYETKTPTEVYPILTGYYNEDFNKDKFVNEMTDFLKHPVYNADYKYLDRANCKLDYFL